MRDKFRMLKPEKVDANAIQLIGYDWLLLTVGNPKQFNTMTASWGSLGYLWNKPIIIVFVRPQRYTFGFIEKEEFFTIQFFDPMYRDALNFCGANSGRDVDKMAETGLTVFTSPKGNVYFEQARIQMECRKLYSDDIKPESFIDKNLLSNYPKNDFHRFYIGEIMDCIMAE